MIVSVGIKIPMGTSLDSLAERLRWLREQAGLPKRTLSNLARLDPSHVRSIEKGTRVNPQSDTVVALAEVLGCTTDWLLRGLGSPPSADVLLDAVAHAKAQRQRPPRDHDLSDVSPLHAETTGEVLVFQSPVTDARPV